MSTVIHLTTDDIKDAYEHLYLEKMDADQLATAVDELEGRINNFIDELMTTILNDIHEEKWETVR